MSRKGFNVDLVADSDSEFRHTTFSIFTACCYLRDSEEYFVSEFVTITSELPDHSRTAAINYLSKVIENVRENHQYLPLPFSFGVMGVLLNSVPDMFLHYCQLLAGH